MPTHAEITQKLEELSAEPVDAEKLAAIDTYLKSLSQEDRVYATTWAATHANQTLSAKMEDLRRRM